MKTCRETDLVWILIDPGNWDARRADLAPQWKRTRSNAVEQARGCVATKMGLVDILAGGDMHGESDMVRRKVDEWVK